MPAGEASGSRRFRDLELPKYFLLEALTATGDWIDWAACRREDFIQNPNGAYVASVGGGSPVWLRCVRQDGNILYAEDGGGDPYTYRLLTLADHWSQDV